MFLAACIVLGGFGDAVAQWRPGTPPGFKPGFRFLSTLPVVLYDFAGNSFPAVSVTRATTGNVQTLAGAWSSVAANTLRRSDRGALVEPGTTNSIRNNSMQGAVAGAPGTAPTNWTVSIVNGLTREVIGVGVEDGIDYIDLRISGTATATTTQSILMETTTEIAAVQGQAWAGSAFVKLTAGSTANVAQFSLRFTERSSGGTALATGIANFTPAVGGALGLQRKAGAYTMANASTAFVQPSVAFSPTIGAVDFTLRIGWPQWEQVASATSPLRTTTAAVARSADAATLTVPAGYFQAFYTFDDDTTQSVAVSPGSHTILTTPSKAIRKLELYP